METKATHGTWGLRGEVPAETAPWEDEIPVAVAPGAEAGPGRPWEGAERQHQGQAHMGWPLEADLLVEGHTATEQPEEEVPPGREFAFAGSKPEQLG